MAGRTRFAVLRMIMLALLCLLLFALPVSAEQAILAEGACGDHTGRTLYEDGTVVISVTIR